MKYLKQTATFWGLVALDSYFTFFGISLLEYLSNLFGISLESLWNLFGINARKHENIAS